MTEQPGEQFQLIVTNSQATAAMATFKARQHIVDQLLPKVAETNPALDRLQAEEEARRLVLSGALCIACGVSEVHEVWLFKNVDYQALLGRMLLDHDSSRKEGQ